MNDSPGNKKLIQVGEQHFDASLIPDISIELRDAVLEELSAYCAEISQELWMNYCTHIVPNILKTEWDNELHLKFLEYRRLIDRQGIFGAAELVLSGLREMVLNQKQ